MRLEKDVVADLLGGYARVVLPKYARLQRWGGVQEYWQGLCGKWHIKCIDKQKMPTSASTLTVYPSYMDREIWCESHGPDSFAPGRKDPGFVLQYL